MKCYLLVIGCGERFRAMRIPAAERWMKCVPELAGWTQAGDSAATRLGFGDLDPARRACMLKLHAFDLVPADADAVLYADLDIFPHPCFPSPATALRDVDFACVRDRWDDAHVGEISRSAGLEPWQYFNAGLWLARRPARRMLEGAVPLFDRLKWWDQTALNVARVTHRTRTRWLPWRCNAMDRHDQGQWISASHAPHHAWPAWEGGGKHVFHGKPETLISMLNEMDWSHRFVTDQEHVLFLAFIAEKLGPDAGIVEVGTFQGHATWALAHGGGLVTTLDPENEQGRRWRGGLSADFLRCRGHEFLDADRDFVCDMVFHDAEHGPGIIPELRRWWERILPGGVLAVHDAEQLEGWFGNDLPGAVRGSVSRDGRGRELMVLTKKGE